MAHQTLMTNAYVLHLDWMKFLEGLLSHNFYSELSFSKLAIQTEYI